MSEPKTAVNITLRVPGAWGHPGELLQRMPEGFQLSPNAMTLPDGTQLEFVPMPPDGQFAQVFRSACRHPATDEELQTVANYQVNIGLSGPGGSADAARKMMQAAAAIVQAGGAGVFIDNCGLAHGGTRWREMTEDGSADALSYAFVAIARGEQEIHTLGMHALGMPELVMNCSPDAETDAAAIIEIVRSVCRDNHKLQDGDLLGDEHAARYRAQTTANIDRTAGTPMHNPFGRLKLSSLKDIAEEN